MRHLFTLLLCFLCWLPLSAQNPAVPQVADVEFTALGWEHAIPELFYTTARKPVSFALPAFERSKPQTYTGPAELAFFTQQAAAEPGLPPVRVPAGQVLLPTGARRVLLLFVPTGAGRFNILALSENTETFPEGQARLFNATRQPLAIKVRDGETLTIPPGEYKHVTGNGRTIGMQIAQEKDGAWKLVASKIFGLKPADRLTVFVTVSNADRFKLTGYHGEEISSGPLQMFSLRN